MKKILIRAPNWIGDQILAYPFFYFLRRAYPSAHIVSACVSWVEDIQFRDLVDDVMVLPRPGSERLSDRWRALEEGAKELRAQGPWDLGISLPNSLSAAWLMKRSNIERRRGFRADGRGLLLNDGVRWARSADKHRSQAYVDLLPDEARPVLDIKQFWGNYPDNDLDPYVPGVLPRFPSEKAWPEQAWLEPISGNYWVLAPGATAESRRWPAEYFIALARKVAAETDLTGVIVGGAKEAELASLLCEDRSLRLVDRTAEGTVPQLYRVFKEAQFTVCNESGLAHVAALCGSFVQIVCGAADPLRTRPIGPGKVQVAVNPIECWPCERNTCDLEAPSVKFSCLLGIQAETVWEEIKRGTRNAKDR